jgi:hypothetical protein
MAGIKFFAVEVPGIGVLEGWRDFAAECPFRLGLQNSPEDTWEMTRDEAARLGARAHLIAARFKSAHMSGKPVKTGAEFLRRDAAKELIVELGIADQEAIYFQFCGLPKVRLPDAQGGMLLEALARFGDEVRTIGGGGGKSTRSLMLICGRT